MLNSFKTLQNYSIQASDGEIGHVANVLFDDQAWTVRYIVINTGNWLFSRHVLIAPVSVTAIDGAASAIQVKLTRQQVELSPSVDTKLPMTREKELELAEHYEYMPYWGGAGAFGIDPVPNPALMGAASAERALERIEREEEAEGPDVVLPHLRSMQEMFGYTIEAQQSSLGHVSDALIDEAHWELRYLVVDSGTLLPGKQWLLAPPWIGAVDWAASTITLDLDPEQIEQAPAFDQDRPFERAYEEQLYAHYSRRPYWENHE